MNLEKLITFAHKNDLNGVRFSQYESDNIPSWAVDIKYVTEEFIVVKYNYADGENQ